MVTVVPVTSGLTHHADVYVFSYVSDNMKRTSNLYDDRVCGEAQCLAMYGVEGIARSPSTVPAPI
jgi:hypothetical protein